MIAFQSKASVTCTRYALFLMHIDMSWNLLEKEFLVAGKAQNSSETFAKTSL